MIFLVSIVILELHDAINFLQSMQVTTKYINMLMFWNVQITNLTFVNGKSKIYNKSLQHCVVQKSKWH